MVLQIERRRFDVEAFERMAEAGILSEDDRVELIDGEIVQMSPIGGPHIGCVNALTDALYSTVRDNALISLQNPISLSEGDQPQPDVTLLRLETPRDIVPRVEHVLVIIEVADTSRNYDRSVKLPMYAAAGIPESWLVDLDAGIIERHTEPHDGVYRHVVSVRRGATLESTVVPTMMLVADAILRPA